MIYYHPDDSLEKPLTAAEAAQQNHVKVYTENDRLFKLEQIRRQTLAWRRYFVQHREDYERIQSDLAQQEVQAAIHIDYSVRKQDNKTVSRRDFYQKDGTWKQSILYLEDEEGRELECYLNADNTITGGRTYHYDEADDLCYTLDYNQAGELYDGYDYNGEGPLHNWRHDELPQQIDWAPYRPYTPPLRADFATVFSR